MITRAYAKINWFLHIIRRKPDGYHELEMIMQHINLFDTILINLTGNKGIELQIENTPFKIAGEDNLIIKAAKAMRKELNTCTGLNIQLKKRIPIGAGLGGGSADAAAVLHALNCLYHLNFSLEKLQKIGLTIGSDVPYCLEEGAAIVRGTGENITPIELPCEQWIIILKPEESLSTKAVFNYYDLRDQNTQLNLSQSVIALMNNDYIGLNIYGGNDLESAAISLVPIIHDMKNHLLNEGALFVQMSGSGSAVFGVFSSKNAAFSKWLKFKKIYKNCWLSKTHLKAKAIPSGQLDV